MPLEFSVRKILVKEEITTFILQQYYDSIETSSGSLNNETFFNAHGNQFEILSDCCSSSGHKVHELIDSKVKIQDTSFKQIENYLKPELVPTDNEIEYKRMIRRNTVRFIKELEKASEPTLINSQTRDSVKEIGIQILKKISVFFNSRKERKRSPDDIVIDLGPKQTLEYSVKSHKPHILDLCLDKLLCFEYLQTSGLIRASGTFRNTTAAFENDVNNSGIFFFGKLAEVL